MPSNTPLTDAINALTQYANETTGASDTTLSDAVGTLVAGYGGGGGSDPWHLETNKDIVITVCNPDWQQNKPVVTTNPTGRRGIFSLNGTTTVYYTGTSTASDVHLIEIPSGATTVTITIDKTCQLAVREFIETDGEITGSVDTTGWLNFTANVATSVTLTSGTSYIACSMRPSSTNPQYTFQTSPLYAKIDFS